MFPRALTLALALALALLAASPGAIAAQQATGGSPPAFPPAFPAELAGITAGEAESLIKGQPLLREVSVPSRLSLAPFDAEAESIRGEIERLKPNYLTEIVALVPYRAGAGQVDKLAAALSDLAGYVGIPYWSVSMQKTYDLFDRMEVLVRKPLPGGVYLEASQHMKPFDDYKASYEYRKNGDSLVFRSSNLTHLSYKGVRSVSPGSMKWFLYVFHRGDFLVYYGAGAVKAFDMLGLIRDRLEVSFIGRVDAFFDHMFARLKG